MALEGDGAPAQVGIVLRPLASALPLGFFAFGIGMFLLGVIGLGWVPSQDVPRTGLILLVFVAPLELAAAALAFAARDTLSATLLGLFGGSWATLGALSLAGAQGLADPGLGWWLLCFSVIIGLLGVLGLQAKPLFSVILFLAAARGVLAGLSAVAELPGLDEPAGVIALIIAVIAFYGGLALAIEDAQQRTVLPVFRRGPAAQALEGDLREQVERAAGEAGVRQQL